MSVVVTPAGALAGERVREPVTGRPVDVFRGVPYAEPPVGARRFAAPEPAAAWRGTRAALAFGPSAPQLVGGPFAGALPGMAVQVTDEDCLTLNVWAPATPARRLRPVLVWLHGGAFVIGGSSLPTYDAALLAAEQDLAVVSVNYRLGALGHLPGLAPNLGLRDQLLALAWVRASITGFGGDPDRVTIVGESAGAGSALYLLTSPPAAGLFHGAVLQSPGVAQTLSAQRTGGVAAAFLTQLGVPADLAALRAVPAEEVVRAQTAAAAALRPSAGSMPFHPSVDGDVVVDTPLRRVAAGAAADVPVLAGCTTDEMRLFAHPRLARLDRAALVPLVAGMVTAETGEPVAPEAVAAAVAAYDGDGAEVFAAASTDLVMRLPIAVLLDELARHQPTYGYEFTWAGAGAVGACHGIDLPFTFGTFDREGWADFVGADADAHRLSAAMRAAWGAFARSGDPSCDALGSWPRYGATRSAMLLGRRTGVVEDPFAPARERCAALLP